MTQYRKVSILQTVDGEKEYSTKWYSSLAEIGALSETHKERIVARQRPEQLPIPKRVQ